MRSESSLFGQNNCLLSQKINSQVSLLEDFLFHLFGMSVATGLSRSSCEIPTAVGSFVLPSHKILIAIGPPGSRRIFTVIDFSKSVFVLKCLKTWGVNLFGC